MLLRKYGSSPSSSLSLPNFSLTFTTQLRLSSVGSNFAMKPYSLRNQLPQDFEGSLRQVAALGYREVEAAGFYGLRFATSLISSRPDLFGTV